MRKICFGVYVSCLFAGLVLAGENPQHKMHYRVVDTTGRPVEGASVCVAYGCVEQGLYEKEFITDPGGRLVIKSNDEPKAWTFVVRKITKEGYDSESKYLNNWGCKIAYAADFPFERPFELTIRKKEPEPEALYSNLSKWNISEINNPNPAPVALSVFDVYKKPGGDDYVDVFVQPHLERQKKEWILSLWTTNVQAGIVASAKRMYVAPEGGYRQRVEVMKSDYLSPTFTLYLKTRPQGLYLMVPFKEDDILADYFEEDKYMRFRFRCRTIQINPYGGRNLEVDTRYGDIKPVLGYKDIREMLQEGKRPPRMDIPARVANRKRWWAAFKEKNERENQELIYARKKMAEIRESMRGRPQNEIDKELKPYKRQLETMSDDYYRLEDEMERLDQELPTLNLPPGMTEKDKYGKVDMDIHD